MTSRDNGESGSSGPPVVGPRLRRLLVGVLLLFALLTINSIYLGGITLLEWKSSAILQNYFYQWMFLAHLALGLLIGCLQCAACADCCAVTGHDQFQPDLVGVRRTLREGMADV